MTGRDTPAGWNDEQAGVENSTEELIRAAMRFADENGWNLSPSRCSRIVRRARHRKDATGEASPQEAADDAFEALLYYCVAYRDPTGEEAAYRLDAAGAAARLSQSRARLRTLIENPHG